MKVHLPLLVLVLGLFYACAPMRPADTQGAQAARVLEVKSAQTALGAFFQGEVAIRNGDYETAMAAYERAAKLDPDEPRLHARLAHLYVRQGNLERALDEATIAVASRPDDVGTRMLRAGALVGLEREEEAAVEYRAVLEANPETDEAYLLLASLHTKWGETAQSKEILERLIEKNPASVMGYYYLGRLHAREGRLDDARNNFEEALEYNGRSALILADLALVEEMRDNPQQANALYRRLLALEPGNELARRRLGGLLAGQKRYDEALNEFRQLEQIEADPTETRLKIGLIYLEQGAFESAAAELSLVHRASPEDHSVSYYLGIVYTETGETARALDVLKTIPPDAEVFTEARLQMAYLAERADDLDAAVTYARQAFEQRPESTGVLEFLIALERESGQLAKATALTKSLVEKDPNSDRYHFMLGTLYDEAGDNRAALLQMRKAIELNPRNAAALNYLGYSYAEAGRRLVEAERLIRRALAVDPNDGFYIDSLGWVLYQRGQYAAAIEQLERAVELTGNDPTINEHLADAYRKHGRELEALQLYREALAASAKEEQSRRIAEKIKAVEQARRQGGSPL